MNNYTVVYTDNAGEVCTFTTPAATPEAAQQDAEAMNDVDTVHDVIQHTLPDAPDSWRIGEQLEYIGVTGLLYTKGEVYPLWGVSDTTLTIEDDERDRNRLQPWDIDADTAAHFKRRSP